jgi:SET domain
MASSEPEDPFIMFGDGGEDDGDDQENEGATIARSLVVIANHKSGLLSSTPLSQPSAADDGGGRTNLELFDVSHVDPLSLPWPIPFYVGPVKLVSPLSYGGGRGYVAGQDLSPGTLILVEKPVVPWPTEQLGRGLDLVSVCQILESVDALQKVHQLEHLHPTKVAVDQGDGSNAAQIGDMIEMLLCEHQESDDRLKFLVMLASSKLVTNSDGSSITKTDILRLLLALRYNGLESGIYLHIAMLNHADQPNCVKFLPESEKTYSEVRTTRFIQAGEHLTISYLPKIVSHSSRRKHLWQQHRFDIGANLAPALRKMELIGSQLPESAINRWDEDSTAHRIELATAELEDLYKDAAEHLEMNIVSEEGLERNMALEQSAFELYAEAANQLKNDSHILLVSCLQLHLDSCDLVQRDSSLSGSQRVSLLGRLVVTARKLLRLQEFLLGPDHFDLARTNLDMTHAVEELLSKAPKHLLSLGLEGMTSVTLCSALARQTRSEYERIRVLYPYDAEERIREQQSTRVDC